MRTQTIAALCMVVASMTIAGCTVDPVDADPVVVDPSRTVTEPPALPTEFLAYEPVPGERAVATLSTQTGINSLGPFRVASDRVAVYVDCIGEGTIAVDISGVARFDNPCYSRVGPLGTRNELDVRYVNDYEVTITATDEQMWAVTITEPDP